MSREGWTWGRYKETMLDVGRGRPVALGGEAYSPRNKGQVKYSRALNEGAEVGTDRRAGQKEQGDDWQQVELRRQVYLFCFSFQCLHLYKTM